MCHAHVVARFYLQIQTILQNIKVNRVPMSRNFIIIAILFLSSPVFSAHLSDDIKLPLTQETAAQLVKSESKGKILSIETRVINDKNIFRIKVIHDSGRMKVYLIDPKTGHSPL